MARGATASQEVDDWITPSADGPDDWITPDAPAAPSGGAALLHGAERGAAPAVGGWAGMAAGAKLGALAGALIPVLGETGVGEVGGAIAGGIAGGLLGSSAVSGAQEKLLDLIPEDIKEKIGQSKSQREAEELAHPYLSMAGELAPNLALLRPGAVATTAREGAGVLERTLSHPVGARAVGAGFNAAQEAGTEYATNGEVDPGKVAIAAGAGALMNRETGLGTKIRTGVEGVIPGPRIHPGATPDEVAAPVMAAESVDEAISAAKTQIDNVSVDPEAMAAEARRQGEAAQALPGESAPPVATPETAAGPDWETLYDEAGAEIGRYNAKTEEIQLHEAVTAAPEASGEEIAPEARVSAENPSETVPEEITPVTQPSARDFPPFADAKTKADTYARWLDELDAQRRDEAAKSPRARFLQQTADAILSKVNGVEERLTEKSAQRLADTRQALDDLLNPVGDSPDMARVRASMVAEHQNMADAVVAHRDDALRRAQEARDHARALEETLTDEEADQIGSSMAAHQIDAGAAVADHIERRALQEVQSDHGQTGDAAYAEALPVRGGAGEIDRGAGASVEGRAPVAGDEGGASAARGPASEIAGQASELIPAGAEAPQFQRPEESFPQIEAKSRYADLSPGSARLKAQSDALANGRGAYRNADTGWDIHLTKSGIRKSLSGDGSKVRAEIVANLPKLLEVAKLSETHPDKASPERPQVHRFAVDMVLDGRVNRLKLTVREDALGAKRHYAVDHVEVEPPGIVAPRGQNPRGPDGSRPNIEAGGKGINTSENTRVYGTFTPEFDVLRDRIGTALRQRLDKMGLHEIALKLPDAIYVETPEGGGGKMSGAYAQKIIAVALETSPDGMSHTGIFDHETVHAARALGLFNKSEWSMLSNRAVRDWRDRFKIDQRYGDLPEEKRNEEAIAEAYRAWAADQGTQKGTLARIFDKMRNTLAAIRSVFRGHGFKTSDSVFRKLSDGKIGARERAEAAEAPPQFQVREKAEDGAVPMRAVYIKETGKVEFRPVNQPAPKPAPVEIKEPSPPRAKPLKAIEGTGPERERAINRELYNVGEEKPQLEAAAALVEKDPERAIAIAMRQKQAPAGLHPEFVYMALEAKAVREGDFDLQYKLRKSKIAEEATTMGQRISAWRNRAEISPVDDMRRVEAARAAKLKERGIDAPKAVETLVTEAKAEIKRAAKTQSLNDFVLANLCPA